MTGHTHDTGATTPHNGDYDPVVADRFRILDRITPPDVTAPTMRMAVPGGSSGDEPSGHRSGFLVAVAASFGVLMIGIVALVAATGGDGTESAEQDGDTPDVPVVADAASDTATPLVVEGDSGATSTTRVEPGAADREATAGVAGDAADGTGPDGSADRGSADAPDTEASDTADIDTARPGTGADAGATDGPATTTAPDVVAPAVDGDRPVSTFSTATTDVLPTTGGSGDAAGGTVSLRGTVTEVFTDCHSRLLLTETGQVVEGGPVTCDGGSSIVVNGTRVFTSSGYTSADLAFDKHPSNLKPGVEVSVTATRMGGASGPLTLACDACRVRIL